MVVVSRKDGGRFIIGEPRDLSDEDSHLFVTEAPAIVISAMDDLTIDVLVGAEWFRDVPHADIAPKHYQERDLVWRWPTRA